MKRKWAFVLMLGVLSISPGVQAGLNVKIAAEGLSRPWSLAFLPDGLMLVTEKEGRMRRITAAGALEPALTGLPAVDSSGQGGLLDVVLDPQFRRNQRIYFCYSEPRENGSAAAVATAILGKTGLTGLQVIYRQQPVVPGGLHFGSRLVFARDGQLFVTLGERGSQRHGAQLLGQALGKVAKLTPTGMPAPGNPFLPRQDALPEIWSLGHRNPQGAALHPQTGELWIHEHGPQGGDEINIVRPGRNYGWPLVSQGEEYGGGAIGGGVTAKPGLEPPLYTWVPSIAPSGMAFYSANRFPQWSGQLFVGSLKFGQLVQLTLNGDRIAHEQRHDIGPRIRDVRQGPDGYLYLLTDENNGRILRVSPTSP